MKKNYKQPELEVIELLAEDILSESIENDDTGKLDNEVTIDGGGLFGNF